MSNFRMVPGLMTEEIDQEILVCDTDSAVVHRVSGPAADVLRQVLATDGAPVALEDDEVTAGLVAAGVLVPADAPERQVDRRAFVRAAAAVSTIGIVTLALPRAAAASSGGGSNPTVTSDGNPVTVEPANTTKTYSSGNPTRIGILWLEESGPFLYQVTISRLVNSGGAVDQQLTQSTLSSTDSEFGFTAFNFSDAEWPDGEWIRIEFITTNVSPPVAGVTLEEQRV